MTFFFAVVGLETPRGNLTIMRGNGKRLPVTTQQSVMEHIAAGEKDLEISAACGVDRHTAAKL